MAYNDAAYKAEAETGARIWIGGLPEKISEAQLRSKFERFGQIVWVRIRSSARDVYAFVQFAEAKEARLACYEMDQKPDFGAGRGGVMKVSMAKPTEAEAQLLRHAGRVSRSPRRRSASRQRYQSPSRSRSRSRSSPRRSRSRRSFSGKDPRGASRDGGKGGRGLLRSRSALPRIGKGDHEGGKGHEGKGKHKIKAIRVRIENLPPDFTDKELRDLGSAYGKLVHVRIWTYQTRTFANIMYDSPDEAMKALIALHDRKVAGWSEALKAQIPCPHCEQCVWD